MRKILIAFVISLVAFSAYYLYTPYKTISDIKNVIETNDGDALSTYIDFERVRESLKQQVNQLVKDELMSDMGSGDPAGTSMGEMLGGMIGGYLTESIGGAVIDYFMTPEVLIAFMNGYVPEYGDETQSGQDASALRDADLSYSSLNLFVISIPSEEEGENPITFLMERNGLFNWQIVEIRIL